MTGNELFDLDTFLFGLLNYDTTLASLLGALNEKVTVNVGLSNSGTFDLTIDGHAVTGNAFNISGLGLQSAIDAVLGPNTVTVTGNGPWLIEFTGNKFNNQQVTVTGDGSNLAGGTLKITETQQGVSRVFADAAPQNTPAPFAIWGFQTSTETVVIGAVRIVFRPLMCIKAVTQENSYANARAIAAQIDSLVMGSKGVVDGLNIACCGSEGAYRYREIVQGLRWNYVGRLYRFFIS